MEGNSKRHNQSSVVEIISSIKQKHKEYVGMEVTHSFVLKHFGVIMSQ